MWVQNLHLASASALDTFPGIERVTTRWDVRLLVDSLEHISAEQATDWHEVPIDVLLPDEDAVLRWYLRNFRNVREVSSVKSIDAPVAITSAHSEIPSGYTGMKWDIETTGLPTDLGGRFYRWWLYREGALTQERQSVILWVKPAETAQ